MRNLFLALLLANLAFAAWRAWFAPDPETQVERETPPPIRLVGEQDEAPGDPGQAPPSAVPASPEQESDAADDEDAGSAGGPTPTPFQGAAAGDAAGPSGSADTARCVSVGPFRELSEAASASARLRAAGYESRQRVGEGDIWVGYWVHLDGLSAREEANAALTTLHENGVAEAYLIPGEEDGDMISLGVFSEISRAGRLRDQVRELGFEPTIVDRTRRGTVHWVDVQLAPAEDLDFETLQEPGRILRLEQRACESAAI